VFGHDNAMSLQDLSALIGPPSGPASPVDWPAVEGWRAPSGWPIVWDVEFDRHSLMTSIPWSLR
jgi:hypothetical protein